MTLGGRRQGTDRQTDRNTGEGFTPSHTSKDIGVDRLNLRAESDGRTGRRGSPEHGLQDGRRLRKAAPVGRGWPGNIPLS